jgi:hypothetical protein
MNEQLVRYIGAGVVGVLLTVGALFGAEEAHIIDVPPETPVEASHPGCPSGWTPDTPDGEDHVIVYKCLRDDWHVVVTETGAFSVAWEENKPTEFIDKPREGWGWPVQ